MRRTSSRSLSLQIDLDSPRYTHNSGLLGNSFWWHSSFEMAFGYLKSGLLFFFFLMTLGSLSPKVLIYFGEDVLEKQHGEMGGVISHVPLAEPFLYLLLELHSLNSAPTAPCTAR